MHIAQSKLWYLIYWFPQRVAEGYPAMSPKLASSAHGYMVNHCKCSRVRVSECEAITMSHNLWDHLIWCRIDWFNSGLTDLTQDLLNWLRTTLFESGPPNLTQDHLIWSRTDWFDPRPPVLSPDHLIWIRTTQFGSQPPDLIQDWLNWLLTT